MEKKSNPKNKQGTETVQDSNLNTSDSQSETVQDQLQEDSDSETVNVTPHKRADFQSPKKKLSSRKTERTASQWKANLRKKARTEGKDYKTKNGKTVARRSLRIGEKSSLNVMQNSRKTNMNK